jgi:hypothetical protein
MIKTANLESLTIIKINMKVIMKMILVMIMMMNIKNITIEEINTEKKKEKEIKKDMLMIIYI